MYKITIKGEAKSSHKNLQELDGINCEDNFADYFADESSYNGPIEYGYMRFQFSNGKLWTITEYKSNVELTTDELNDLSEYTQGQWSDGIGECFEQDPVMIDDNGEDVYVSPWFRGQELIITQEKI